VSAHRDTARRPRRRAHRVLYAAKTTVECSGLVPGFDVAELIALLAHPGATVIDTAVIDGLVVAVGQRSRSTGSG